jgi:ligand-binding SRPBCC domain-containing protein
MIEEVLQDHVVIRRRLVEEWEHAHDDRNDSDLCVLVDDVRQGNDQRLQELLGGQFDSLVIEHVHQQNERVTSKVFELGGLEILDQRTREVDVGTELP